MNKQTQEALKMAIEQAIIEFEVLSSFPQYDLDYVDMIKELRGCLEALEQPTHPITEGATMFKQVGNSPKPPSPPPPMHTCIYSRTMNQEYPRKCIQCGKVEALEQPAQERLTTLDEIFADEMFRLNRDIVPLPEHLIHEIAQRNFHPSLGINPITFTLDVEKAHGIGVNHD